MQNIGILYLVVLFLITFMLTIGGYMLQRDRYWRRVWEDMGKPEVNSIKELKHVKKQSQSKKVLKTTHDILLHNKK